MDARERIAMALMGTPPPIQGGDRFGLMPSRVPYGAGLNAMAQDEAGARPPMPPDGVFDPSLFDAMQPLPGQFPQRPFNGY